MTLHRRFGWTLAVGTIVGAITGCARDPVSVPNTDSAKPLTLDAMERQVASASNDFSFALFQQLAHTEAGKNVVVSPLSASMSLGMTLNGASGSTYDAMHAALRLGTNDLALFNSAYQGLIGALQQADSTTTFHLANSIWYRNGLTVQSSFVDAARSFFFAQVQGLDFANQSAALAAINGWVSRNTGGLIPTILDQITPDEVMFLINAIYFKGTWQVQFDPKKTSPSQFIAADGTFQSVPFMNRPEHLKPLFKFGGYRGLSVAELPYGNGNYAMDILMLPYVLKSNIDSVSAALTPAVFDSLLASLKDVDFALAMPKFTISYERVLNPELTTLGMGIAFTDAANFSAMSPQPLKLEFVKQKTYIDVNEAGTEAGASTVTGAIPVSLTEFRVDRPFIFIIRERQSGSILFIGKVLRIP